MKIIVYVKQVKYVYAQTGFDPKQNFIGPDDIIHLLNPFDEMAVEEALRVKDKHPNTEVLVISLGDQFAEEGLRRCLAMGADRAIHLYTEEDERLDSKAKAAVLAQPIRNLRFDLIFCGKESIDDQRGLVGPYLAEALKIPFVSRVVKLEIDESRSKTFLHRALERGNRETMETSLPALFTVEKGINVPRYPTLPGRLMAETQRIERFDPKDLGLSIDPFDSGSYLTETIRLSPPKPKKRAGAAVDAKLSATDRLKSLMKGGDSKKKEDTKIFEGSSDKVLNEFERVLKENGITFE